MNTNVLEDLGFTKSEIKVYLALIELGKGGAGNIISNTSLQSSVVHMTLNKLLEKGLISYIKKGHFREYSPKDPKKILEYIDKKKSKFEEILPQILAKRKILEKNEAEVYKGLNGLKTAVYDMIENANKDDEFLFFSFNTNNPSDFNDVYEFYKDFANDRERFDIITKGIISNNIKDKFIGRIDIQNLHFTDLPTLDNISIFNNKVLMTPWEEEKISFLITSKQLADSFRAYFYTMWKK